MLAPMPFARATKITLEEADPGLVRGSMPWAPERCTAGGLLHGGAVMCLADTVGAVCAFLNLPPGTVTSTVESKTNFFRGVRSGTLGAVARPLHVGASFIVVQTELSDDEGRRVGLTVQSQAVLDGGRAHPGRSRPPHRPPV
ncbi:PaaI family thioesterase [Streptomyces sp. NPDC050263]|uniref:PaaI family thioesterase n=1 Tax=Streptomyces sp. NPDC050263 TaxID=3155037 RepID=UPI003417AC87